MKWTIFLFLGFAAVSLFGADSPQFRGVHRDGKFPETGLLKQWPNDGPQEIWSADGLGAGFSSITVAGGKIFITGIEGNEGYLHALDLKGNRIWKTHYGPEHQNGFPGARTTPTVDGDSVYLMTSLGKLACYDAASGEERWSVDTVERFGGGKTSEELIPAFGIAEAVLIDGGLAICTPGGNKAALVGVDKTSGKTVWTTEGLDDKSGYCSARIFDNGKHRQLITLTSQSLLGLDPQSGEIFWRHDYPAKYGIHAISPVYHQNYIYVSDGYNQGGRMVELAEDGRSVTQRWAEESFDVHHGGVIQHGGYLYGANSGGAWMCLDIATGEVKKSIEGVGKGSAIYADGMLYGYGESGKLGLFKADPASLEMVSSFEIGKGSGRHWAHPVISDGVLYVRHGDVLMAFDIKKENI